MKYVNRAVIIVMPNDAFVDWVNEQFDDDQDLLSLDDMSENASAYLVNEMGEDSLEDVIAFHFTEIFEEQLDAWLDNETQWPESLSLTLFNEWFDISLHESVADLGGLPIRYEVV